MRVTLLALVTAGLVTFAPVSAKDFTEHQLRQLTRITSMDVENLRLEDFLEFRKTLTDLATANPERTLRATKGMLEEIEFFKKRPEAHFLLTKSVELNRELIFALLAMGNGLPLDDFTLADLRGRFDGISDGFSKDQAKVAAEVFSLLMKVNDSIKEE